MQTADELLADLTDEQRAAAMHIDGPLLIIAGAGSGKTRVLTRRVAYMIAQGIPANAICAITFTNKAAGEMKARVEKIMDRPIRDFGKLDQRWPTICTFHSLCLRILRHYAEQVGLPANFSIYDSADQNKVLKDALKALDISSTNFQPAAVHAAISKAKNQLLTPQKFAQTAGDFYQRTVARAYTKYQAMLDANGALDFDDLLLRTAAAFRDHPDVLRELQDRFQYLMIDEYQDTNHAQYIIAHALAQRHRNMCVVGDPDQSIYAWRGADIQNILDFEKDYTDATIIKLERNYRSTKTILALADALIANNSQRKDKRLWTENADGEMARVFFCQDERDEAEMVTQQLKSLHDEQKIDWSKMAIFYRMNALSRVMEDALRKNAVPYTIARGVEFYNRKEIKDVLAYLRVIANPSDAVSLARVVNVPTRGIGDSSVKLMDAYGISNGISLAQSMAQVEKVTGLSSRAVNATRNFVQLLRRWRQIAGCAPVAQTPPAASPTSVGTESTPKPTYIEPTNGQLFPSPGTPGEGQDAGDSELGAPSADQNHPHLASPGVPGEGQEIASPKGLVQRVMEDVVRTSGLEALYRKTGDADLSELANVNELISSAAEYDDENPDGTLEDYLAQVSLVSDADHMKGTGGSVTLMTLHAAKGLEFPVVALIGLEEGCLPHSRSRGNPIELEEERRLCFVGITRAEQHLIITKAAYRTMRGLRERTIPSPFLNELPQDKLAIIDRTSLSFDSGTYPRSGGTGYGNYKSTGAGSYGATAPSDRRYDTQPTLGGFRAGQLVRHPKFGLGRIFELADAGQNTRAIVDFNTGGRKTLILEYARLEAVG
ncbi:MAG TPA: UvrD-helicase domain-containing protein [Tepidisphaeraceae bacterium]|nr:UvrD-helicase domain-containing protein [Tepidisphaeraceae bacterium]